MLKENIKKKFQDSKLALVDEVIDLDSKSRAIKLEADNLRAERNKCSKMIGALMGQGKRDEAEAMKKQVAEDAKRLAELEALETEYSEKITKIMMIIPNIIAMFKGDKIKGTLVDTALLGALFVLICDTIARSIIVPYELPIELIVGIIGSILFIAMLIYKLNYGKKAIRLSKGKEESSCV